MHADIYIFLQIEFLVLPNVLLCLISSVVSTIDYIKWLESNVSQRCVIATVIFEKFKHIHTYLCVLSFCCTRAMVVLYKNLHLH